MMPTKGLPSGPSATWCPQVIFPRPLAGLLPMAPPAPSTLELALEIRVVGTCSGAVGTPSLHSQLGFLLLTRYGQVPAGLVPAAV